MKRLIYLLLFLILPLCGMTGCALDESVSSIAPKVGDAVYAKNEKNGQTAYKPVTAHYHNNYTQAVYLTIAAPDGKTQTIVSNAIHPFLAQIDGKTKAPTAERHRYQGAIPNAQWIAASDLRAGYRLLGDDENWHTVQHVKTTLESLKAYNLTVADYRTFFIKGTEGTNGVWVHNDCWNILPDNATRRNIGGKEVYTFTDKGKTVHAVKNQNWVKGGAEPKYFEVKIENNKIVTPENLTSTNIHASKRSDLESLFGETNVTSTTTPKKPLLPVNSNPGKGIEVFTDAYGNKAIKVEYIDPLTGMQKIANIPQDPRGFLIFDNVTSFTAKLERSLSYEGQMRAATRELRDAINRGRI